MKFAPSLPALTYNPSFSLYWKYMLIPLHDSLCCAESVFAARSAYRCQHKLYIQRSKSPPHMSADSTANNGNHKSCLTLMGKWFLSTWNPKPSSWPQRKRLLLSGPRAQHVHRVLYWPTAVVVAAHEHFPASTADGAVGLVAIVVILVGTLQEWVLPGYSAESEGGRGSLL